MPSDGRSMDRSALAPPPKSHLVPRAGACTTAMVTGPEVIVPLRTLRPGLGSTVKLIAPLPVCCVDVLSIHGEAVDACQLQPPPAVAATARPPPAAPMSTELCDADNGQPEGCCT